ncbi:MAG: Hpt domain-containing protein [Chloroflexota bacterium]|nr:Hpt domain-containing protein [Chloroflexota bacterium]
MTFNPKALDEYRSLLGDDFIPFFEELIDTYLQNTPNLLQSLQDALDGNDIELFTRSAHSLKSNSRTFGADGFADMAFVLEEIGNSGNLEDADENLAALIDAYPQVVANLKGLQANIVNSG